jgi:copper resistance protein B
MSTCRDAAADIPHRLVWLVLLWAAFPLAVPAQRAGVAASSSASIDVAPMSGMDHTGVSGIALPTAASSTRKPTITPGKNGKPVVVSTPLPQRAGSTHGADHDAMPDMGAASHPAALPVHADDSSKASHHHMSGEDHDVMPDMASTAKPAAASAGGGQGVDHGHTSGAHHALPAVHGTTASMHTGPMQGGSAPPDARSPDYSDGFHYGPMESMEMHDNAPLSMWLFDQLEAFHARDGNGQAWEGQGWYGNDAGKLWIRTEGERNRGRLEDAEVEVLWNRSVATFWSSQLGARHEWGRGPDRNWIALGLQGLAPYWFELEATAYVGPSGRSAARLRAEYELLFTQRLVLQPEFEVNVYGRSDPARRIGSGISNAQLGLRLRYEIRREFAPYIGVVLTKRYGATASYARRDGHPLQDWQFVVGMRIWF